MQVASGMGGARAFLECGPLHISVDCTGVGSFLRPHCAGHWFFHRLFSAFQKNADTEYEIFHAKACMTQRRSTFRRHDPFPGVARGGRVAVKKALACTGGCQIRPWRA